MWIRLCCLSGGPQMQREAFGNPGCMSGVLQGHKKADPEWVGLREKSNVQKSFFRISGAVLKPTCLSEEIFAAL